MNDRNLPCLIMVVAEPRRGMNRARQGPAHDGSGRPGDAYNPDNGKRCRQA